MSVANPDPTPSLDFRDLLEAAPDAMLLIDARGTILLASAQTEALFGYARSELIGRSYDMLIPEALRAVHARHEEGYRENPQRRPMGSGLDLRGRRKDGSAVPIEVSLSPLRAGSDSPMLAAVRDVSERKQMEATLKVGHDRLTSAIESIEEAFVLFDADDHLVLCNSKYKALMGDAVGRSLERRSYEEMLDDAMAILVFESDVERAGFRERRLAERHHPTVVTDVRTTAGRTLRILDRRTPDGGLVKTIWDLTDDVRREAELREARASADAANAAKTEFLSSMSHELRTPLNAILGFAQLLQRDKKEPLSDRHQARLHQIAKSGQHLLHLIDDVLDLARIEAGRTSVTPEPLAVPDVLDEVKATLETTAARADIDVEIAPVPSGTPPIFADRTRFAQILMNFGSNAIKYNRPGGKVTFRVSVPDAGRLRVSVADTGFGIAPDKQKKLFLPFERAGQETGPIEGTGIGLAITRRLANLMRGSVGFQSEPSRGSEFWVELPVHGTADAEAPPEPRPVDPAP